VVLHCLRNNPELKKGLASLRFQGRDFYFTLLQAFARVPDRAIMFLLLGETLIQDGIGLSVNQMLLGSHLFEGSFRRDMFMDVQLQGGHLVF
jgi:hypothetical protein